MTNKERLKKAWNRFRNALADLRKHSGAYVAEAAETNFHRYKLLVLLAIPTIAGVILWLSLTADGDDAAIHFWRQAVIVVDIILATALVLSFLVIAWFRQRRWHRLFIASQYVVIACLIAVNATITIIGQYVGPNISVFIYACVLAGFAFHVRPSAAITIFATNFVYLYFGLAISQADPVLLASNRINALLTVTLGLFVSVVGWTNFMARSQRVALVEKQKRELETVNRELYDLSRRDRLSGLLNRGAMEDAIRQAYLASGNGARPVSIFIIDLDDFKSINDGYGHPVGDKLIRDVARILADFVPTVDLASRWGGDEFLVACPGKSLRETRALAERIRDTLASTPFTFEGQTIKTSVSIGVSLIDETFDLGYRNADKALYLAKRSGKNRVMTSEDL